MKKVVVTFIFIIISVVAISFLSVSSKPNIIIISLDLLQAQRLHSYGYPLRTTPHLDNFFDTSYLFMNAIAPSSWTLPSTMSVITSLYPSQHHMNTIDPNPLSSSITTFPEILKKNNYVTAAFVNGNSGFESGYGFNRGFDVFYESFRKRHAKFVSFSDTILQALDWLKKNKHHPFFLFLQGFDLHEENDPPDDYDYQYVKKPYTGIYTGVKEEGIELVAKTKAKNLYLSEEDADFWGAIYDEKIRNTDKIIGEFFAELERSDLAKNTLILFLSSHGQELYEHKGFGHGRTLYNEVTHVPFAIQLPGQKKGKRIDDLVSMIDIAPTVLNILKISSPSQNQMKGIDVTPAFYGKHIGRDVYSELHPKKFSIQTPDGWKFILTAKGKKILSRELYYIFDDHGELKNLVGKNPQKTYELEQKLYSHISISTQ